MARNQEVSRRTVLKGLGTTIALPLLEGMWPAVARAAVAAPPRRLAFIFIPIGAHMPDWTPIKTGADFELRPILEPLANVKDRLLVLSGLTHDKARPNGDGAGDHARSASCFLTASQARKTAGADIKVGVSIDQVAAERIGSATK